MWLAIARSNQETLSFNMSDDLLKPAILRSSDAGRGDSRKTVTILLESKLLFCQEMLLFNQMCPWLTPLSTFFCSKAKRNRESGFPGVPSMTPPNH